MAITHNATIRNTLTVAIRDAIDAGAGAGKLVFLTSADSAVATLTLSKPCGTVSGAVLTFASITSDTNAAGGVIQKFKITTSAGTEIVYGSVATSGADINLSNVTVLAGDSLSLSSLTYTAPV